MINPEKEASLIISAILDFYITKDGVWRLNTSAFNAKIRDTTIDHIIHFAKQGVKVRVK